MTLINDFRSVVNKCQLVDLGYSEFFFTWSNWRKANIVYARLDYFLANQQWLSLFSSSVVVHLNEGSLNHLPIYCYVIPMKLRDNIMGSLSYSSI